MGVDARCGYVTAARLTAGTTLNEPAPSSSTSLGNYLNMQGFLFATHITVP